MISPQIPSDMKAEVFLEPAFSFQGLRTKEIKSYWTCAWQRQRTPGLAQISYAEGLKCTPYSYTTEKKRKKKISEQWWDSLYTQTFSIFIEKCKKKLFFFASSHVVIVVVQILNQALGHQA